jgi:hypothetical protein
MQEQKFYRITVLEFYPNNANIMSLQQLKAGALPKTARALPYTNRQDFVRSHLFSRRTHHSLGFMSTRKRLRN